MRYLIGIIPTCLIGLTASACYANLSYNAEHDAALKNLTSVESANINMHFQCGKHSLIMSIFATQSDINGRNAAVTAKITSDKTSHDISALLGKAISRDDVLSGQMSVGCNAEMGAFKIIYSPSEYQTKNSSEKVTISIFLDGTVEGFRQF